MSNLTTITKAMVRIAKTKKPILLRGYHGTGKSEVVYQFAKLLCMEVIERRASQMTEGDLLGLPKQSQAEDGTYVTSFCPPDWFHQACTHPVVLFLDEIGRALLGVRQGLFQLTDSRTIFGNTLHPDTIIIAADNSMEDCNDYQVSVFDPAELDRYAVFDFQPTKEEWFNWAASYGLHRQILAFLMVNSTHLESDSYSEPNKVQPTRRSWTRLSDVLSDEDAIPQNDEILLTATAFVGNEAAIKFLDYVGQQKIITIHDVLKSKKALVELQQESVTTMLEIIEQFGVHYTDKELKASEVKNLAEFFVILDDELKVTLYSKLKDNKTRYAFLDTEVNGKDMMHYVQVAVEFTRENEDAA